ncbi:hypothetical protein BH10ACI3_BH10ACI3_01110 [soil metagenome]
MNPCQNCGKLNSPDTHFCRFCGTKFLMVKHEPLNDSPYDYNAPRPYAWKTDEYQTQNESRKTIPIDLPTQQIQTPAQNRPVGFASQPASLTYQQPPVVYGSQIAPRGNYAMDANYHCPRCGSSYLPVIEKRISTAGWVVFSALLVFTFIFFWVGLLMKEEVAICPVCKSKVS